MTLWNINYLQKHGEKLSTREKYKISYNLIWGGVIYDKFCYKKRYKFNVIFRYNVIDIILKFNKKRIEIKSILQCHVP